MLDFPTPDAPQMSVTIQGVPPVEAFMAPILPDHEERTAQNARMTRSSTRYACACGPRIVVLVRGKVVPSRFSGRRIRA
jgi:hypothetical protein